MIDFDRHYGVGDARLQVNCGDWSLALGLALKWLDEVQQGDESCVRVDGLLDRGVSVR